MKQFIRKILPMSDGEIDLLASKASPLEFEKGDLFVREGEICHSLLFIRQGVFRYFILHKGEDYTKDFAVDTQNPFCTAYTSFMLQKPSAIYIEALEPCRVWSWKRSDVLSLFEEHPVWMRFAKAMADRLFYRKEQREIELLKSSATEKYRQFLVDFPQLSQRVSQYHIASYLGIAPESLSRIRHRLAKAKPHP